MPLKHRSNVLWLSSHESPGASRIFNIGGISQSIPEHATCKVLGEFRRDGAYESQTLASDVPHNEPSWPVNRSNRALDSMPESARPQECQRDREVNSDNQVLGSC